MLEAGALLLLAIGFFTSKVLNSMVPVWIALGSVAILLFNKRGAID